MSYSASSYGPPRSDGGGFRGRGGGFRGGRNDSFRGGGRGSFHQRNDDRGRGGDSRYQPREQQPQQQQGAPPLPPPENDSSSGPPGCPDSARTGGNSRPQYSRYGTLITDGGEPGINSSSSSSSSYRGGGGDRGRGGRDGGMPRYQNARGPPRPMMFVPPPHMNGAPRPMGMAPMIPHAGGAPVGGRGGHPVIGGLHVQLARGPPVMGGPVQMMHPQVFQVAPQQPPLPAPSNASPLPAGWSEHYTPQGLQYFFNTATGVSTYERPTAAAAATAPVDNGSSTMSQENGGGDAGEGKWIEYKDDASGQLYYYHTATRETVWEQPKEFRIQQARDEVERMKKVAEEQAAAETQAEEAKKKQDEEQKAKIYDHLSREERVALFKEFLEHKEISPQLKWQDAQRFIAKEGLDKDPRWKFALTSAGEKKQSFAEYCTQAINKQNIEKRRQVKKNREDFLELLAHFESLFVPGSFTKIEEQKKKSNSSSSVIELEDVVESPHFYAVRQDARWLVIEDQKEKRNLFNGFMQDVMRKHDQLVAKQREAIKKQFIELLRKKVDANEILLRGKRRLDSSLKTQLWGLLQEVGASAAAEDAHNTTEALKSVEKYDAYDWSEEFMTILRDEEYEQRKRERELWREREAQLLKELEEELRAMVETAELTAAKQWEQVRDLLSPVDSENTTEETLGNAEAKPNEQQQRVEKQKLSERAQMRVFEKVVEELRLALQPTVNVVSTYLSKASKGTGGFEVHEACSYEAFADALTEGVKTTIEEKKPEDGEEEDMAMDDDAGVSTAAGGDEEMKGPAATGATATSPDAQKRQIQDELESLVKNIMEIESETESSNASISVEFPQYVREVYDLLVTLAKEKKAAASAAAAAPAAPNLPSSSDKDGNPRNVRSTSRSRKRRRDDDLSRSISRSRSRPRLQARSRSRSPPARSRSRSKPLDRSVVWNTSSSSTSKFIYDPLNGDDEDLTLPKKAKTAPLTAEEESARAEEIIRQARLKLQAKQDAKKKQQQDVADAKAEALAVGAHAVEEESELEDGEEPEEGEEEEK